MFQIQKSRSKSVIDHARWWCFAALFLLPLSVEAGVPGFEMQHVGPMEQPDYRAGFVLAEDASEGRALLFGGITPSDIWTPVIREYTASSDTWRVLPFQLPYAYVSNERHGAARASNGRYYLGPGNGPGGWGQNDQIIEVDVDTGMVVERAPIVAPGSNIWGIALAPGPQSGVYLFGGWNGGGIDAIRHYDPQTDQVRTLAARLAVPRTVGARVTHPNGLIYLFGGNTGTAASIRAAEVFDPATETLRQIPNPGLFGFSHVSQAWVGSDQAIYLWNPEDSYLGNGTGHLVRFDPVGETFEDLGDQPLSGYRVISAWRDSGGDVFFFGISLPGYGQGGPAATLGEVWRLHQKAPASASDYRVVFIRGSYPNLRPWIANLDGSDVAELADVDVDSYVKIAAGKVVFSAQDYHGQGPGIYTMAAAAGSPVFKIPNTENSGGINKLDALDISPDGQRVVWTGPEPGDGYTNHNLYVINIDGSGKTRIRRNTSQHHFSITWGEPERISLMISNVGNAYGQRPHSIRPDGSGLVQTVGDFAQSPHVGGVEGRAVMTWEQPQPYLVSMNNAFEDFREVPGRLTGFTLTAWHPNQNVIFGCGSGDLDAVDLDTGTKTVLVAAAGLPCVGGDVGLGASPCTVSAFPGPQHCTVDAAGEPQCDLDGWTLAGIGSANQLDARVIAEGDYQLALTSDGSTAYLASDNAGFFYRQVSGDFRFEATLDSAPMTTGKEWRKAGLMARASLDTWDVRLLAFLAPVQAHLQFVAREHYGGPGNVKLAYEIEGAPSVVRLSLERVGPTLTVQYSLDGGITWITPATGLGGSIEIPDLPNVLLVGMAMVSNNVSVTSTGHFDDVSLCVADP